MNDKYDILVIEKLPFLNRVFYFITKCKVLETHGLPRTFCPKNNAETPENPIQSRGSNQLFYLMSKRRIKAIHVDAVAKTITPICIKPKLRNYYQLIGKGCTCIGMFNYDKSVDIIHDDEGLYNAGHCVILDNASVMFGSLIFVDVDLETGDTVSTSLTVEQVREIVRFPNEVDNRRLMNYHQNSTPHIEVISFS